jgi:hypothetical protein
MIEFGKSYYQSIAYLAGILNSMTFDFLISRRIKVNLSFSFVFQTPIPSITRDLIWSKITQISARLNAVDHRFKELADAVGITYGNITVNERVQLHSKLDAIVAHHYGLTREEYKYILDTFGNPNKETTDLPEARWDDKLIRLSQPRMRRLALEYYDSIVKSGDMCK